MADFPMGLGFKVLGFWLNKPFSLSHGRDISAIIRCPPYTLGKFLQVGDGFKKELGLRIRGCHN
jgi:hypothetical protein